MSTLQSFHMFLNELLTSVAVVNDDAVEKTVDEYQNEDRLRRMLQITHKMLRITPEIRLCRIDSLQFSVSEEEVPPEQQHCEQEWSPSLGQEDPEPTQIKEEQEEPRTSQEEEQFQGLLDINNSILTPPSVKSECDQKNPLWSLTPPQSQNVFMMTHLSGTDIPLFPSNIQKNSTSDMSAVKQLPTTSKLTYTGEKKFIFVDYSNYFSQKKSLNKHKLIHTTEKKFSCGDCGKIFIHKDHLIAHVHVHTKERTFSCTDCGKSLKGNLNTQKLTHTAERKFRCGDCAERLRLKGNLNKHKLTPTGDKKFSCGNCGKRFILEYNLNRHKRIHTGEKGNLNTHKLTHTSDKKFSCGNCGKRFSNEFNLNRHEHIHTGEKPFSCGDCGKTFCFNNTLIAHKRIHTG